MRASFALVSLILAACDVEPPNLPPLDASFPDAQPRADGGPQDAEVDAGKPDARPLRCTSTGDCADDDRCARPLVGTSTIDPGFCKGASRLTAICATDGECAAGEVCTAHGYCALAAVAVAGNLPSVFCDSETCAARDTIAAVRTLSLISSCSADVDCGPAGLCDESAGACTSCRTNEDCPRQLQCQDGACVEHLPCGIDDDCFPDNECMGLMCVRKMTCRTDGGDMLSNAVQLEPALYQELGLCGDRPVGWFAFDISGREGARIALTSTRSEATVVMDLFDDNGAIIDEARWLSLPGLSVVEVPAPGFDDNGVNLDRRLRIRVMSLDHEGRYDLDLQRLTPLCPGDALDQYGDRHRARALPIEGNLSYLATACPGDEDNLRIDVGDEDQILLHASFAGSNSDLDLGAYSGTATLALGRSASTSSEALDTGRIPSATTVQLRTIAKQAPSAGQDYRLDVTRLLGTFFRECRDVGDLALVNGAAQVEGDLTAAIDLGAPLCANDLYAAPRRSDLLYRITPPSAPSLLRVLITPTGGSSSEITAAIVSECATETSMTRRCDSAELPRRALPLELELTTTAPVFLLVSSDGITEDMRFTMDVLVEPLVAPANDSCAGSINIAGSGSIEVNTYGASNNVEATSFACGLSNGEAAGPESFYRLQVSGGDRAAVELAGPRGGLLWVATDCAQMTATCTTAEAISYVDPIAQVSLTPLIDATFFIAVDGLGPLDEGIFDLRTVLNPECLVMRDCAASLRCDDYRCVPPPANDTCAGAQPLTLVVDPSDGIERATVIASTGAATNNIIPREECGLGASSEDVVYRVDLPLDRSFLTARVIDARFDPALMIRRATCDASIDEVCNDDVRLGDLLLPEVTYLQPPAGTYYVIVDAYAGKGTFTLEVEALP